MFAQTTKIQDLEMMWVVSFLWLPGAFSLYRKREWLPGAFSLYRKREQNKLLSETQLLSGIVGNRRGETGRDSELETLMNKTNFSTIK